MFVLFRLSLVLSERKAGSQFGICIFGSLTLELQFVIWAELSRGDRLKTGSQFVVHFISSCSFRHMKNSLMVVVLQCL